MKALRHHEDGLKVDKVRTPPPGPNEVLIEVQAAAITAGELEWPETLAREEPIPGHDVAGTIAIVGENVKGFKEGDNVFALLSLARDGAAAQYVIADSSELALKPSSLTFEEAASIPLSALTAWQAVYEHADASPHEKVLITGAGGRLGVMAVQFARLAKLKVSALCSADEKTLVRSLGAWEIFEYEQTHLENLSHDFDVIIDCIGGETLKEYLKLVKFGGKIISLVGDLTSSEKAKRSDVDVIFAVAEPDGEELARIARLYERGVVQPMVQTVLPLERGAEAFGLLNDGHSRGNIVLTVDHNELLN